MTISRMSASIMFKLLQLTSVVVQGSNNSTDYEFLRCLDLQSYQPTNLDRLAGNGMSIIDDQLNGDIMNEEMNNVLRKHPDDLNFQYLGSLATTSMITPEPNINDYPTIDAPKLNQQPENSTTKLIFDIDGLLEDAHEFYQQFLDQNDLLDPVISYSNSTTASNTSPTNNKESASHQNLCFCGPTINILSEETADQRNNTIKDSLMAERSVKNAPAAKKFKPTIKYQNKLQLISPITEENPELYGQDKNFRGVLERGIRKWNKLCANVDKDTIKSNFIATVLDNIKEIYINIAIYPESQQLRYLVGEVGLLNVCQYSTALSLYLKIIKSTIKIKNISVGDVYLLNTLLFIQMPQNVDIRSMYVEPNITTFFLFLASDNWNIDDLKKLSARITHGCKINGNGHPMIIPAISTVRHSKIYFDAGVGEATSLDSFKVTLSYLNVIFNDPEFKKKINEDMRRCLRTCDENYKMTCYVLIKAFSTYHFTIPLFDMCDAIMKLTDEDKIHEQYIIRLQKLLCMFEVSVFEMLENKLWHPREKKTGLAAFVLNNWDTGFLNGESFDDLSNKFISLMAEWCWNLNSSNNVSLRSQQYLITNALKTLSNMAQMTRLLLMAALGWKNKKKSYTSIYDANIFKWIIFNGFDLENIVEFINQFYKTLYSLDIQRWHDGSFF